MISFPCNSKQPTDRWLVEFLQCTLPSSIFPETAPPYTNGPTQTGCHFKTGLGHTATLKKKAATPSRIIKYVCWPGLRWISRKPSTSSCKKPSLNRGDGLQTDFKKRWKALSITHIQCSFPTLFINNHNVHTIWDLVTYHHLSTETETRWTTPRQQLSGDHLDHEHANGSQEI